MVYGVYIYITIVFMGVMLYVHVLNPILSPVGCSLQPRNQAFQLGIGNGGCGFNTGCLGVRVERESEVKALNQKKKDGEK